MKTILEKMLWSGWIFLMVITAFALGISFTALMIRILQYLHT